MIVIPDIHGRTFWKEAVNGHEDDEIVFLGDYLDPYPDEGIETGEAFENFKEIVKFKKEHDKNVTLLIGNHDQHYFIEHCSTGSRFHVFHFNQYRDFYNKNREIFQICRGKIIGSKRFIFSHAGITRGWKDEWFEVPDEQICDEINEMYLRGDDISLGPPLSDISYIRGGYSRFGSITWADVEEHYKETENHVADYQVFGHTQLKKDPIITGHFACIDARRGFIIDNNGKVLEMDGTPAVSCI